MSYQLKLWDSKREREKINQPEHTARRSQNKGTEQVQRSYPAADGPLPAGGRRQGGGERGRLGPRDCIPYHTADRPPVSNQRLPEILDSRHLPGGSRRDTGCVHPTSAGGDWGWGREGRRCTHPGRVRPSSSWLPEPLGPGKAQNAGAASSALLWNTGGLEPCAAQGTLHREQPGA